MKAKVGVGLYGTNGHQVQGLLRDCPFGEIVATAGMDCRAADFAEAKAYRSLEEMLRDPRVELVSLCSPRRIDQAADAIACLSAGKHVYAEKPAAFLEESLNAILGAARANDRQFHEMADTVFQQPFFALRELARSGRLGEIVQVGVQKSYKSGFDHRPKDEDVDGGLIRQCAIHGVRMVEHLTGIPVREVTAWETGLGNPHAGNLHTAAAFLLAMENGGVGSVLANYLNPSGFGQHGNDQVRIFGTKGMAEITDNGAHSRVIVGGEDLGPLDTSATIEPYFHTYLKTLRQPGPLPLSLEEELHPLRVVIRAKSNRAYLDCQPSGPAKS